MNRRDLLRRLGLGSAVLAVTPSKLLSLPTKEEKEIAGPPEFYKVPPRDLETFRKYLEQDFPKYQFRENRITEVDRATFYPTRRFLVRGPVTDNKWRKLKACVPTWNETEEWYHGLNVYSELYAVCREYVFLDLFLTKVFHRGFNPPERPVFYRQTIMTDYILIHDSDIAPWFSHNMPTDYLPTWEQLQSYHRRGRS